LWLQPHRYCSQNYHRQVVGGTLFLAGRHPTELLVSIDEPSSNLLDRVTGVRSPW
jgi:hypothetical protein